MIWREEMVISYYIIDPMMAIAPSMVDNWRLNIIFKECRLIIIYSYIIVAQEIIPEVLYTIGS